MSGNLKYTVLWDGENLSCNEVAEKVGRNSKTVRSWIKKHKCDTKKKILDMVERLKETPRGNESQSYKTLRGLLTVREMLSIHDDKDNVTVSLIRNRIRSAGSMSATIWFPDCTRAEFNDMLVEHGLKTKYKNRMPNYVTRFNRGKFCFRENFENKCVNYSFCQDYRIRLGKHSNKFMDDGTCFEGMRSDITTCI